MTLFLDNQDSYAHIQGESQQLHGGTLESKPRTNMKRRYTVQIHIVG